MGMVSGMAMPIGSPIPGIGMPMKGIPNILGWVVM
jgi:hypothetical protein